MKIDIFLKRSRGSATIMLCILMLPMILFSSLVVDVSRIMYAKSIIGGAGDLVLNAQMSEFDRVLKDMYGIFAASSNEEELKEALRSYYDQTIRGILPELSGQDDEIGKVVNELLGLAFDRESAGSIDFSNIINLALEDGAGGFTITGVAGSAIANPAVLKRQIIDAMKYRGPVSVASSLLTKLHALKDSRAQNKVVEKKLEYAKSLDELSQACIKAAEDIALYDSICDIFNDRLQDKEFQKDICNRARFWYFGALVAEQYAIRVSEVFNKRTPKEDVLEKLNNTIANRFPDDSQKILDTWKEARVTIDDLILQRHYTESMDSSARLKDLEDLNVELDELFCYIETIVNSNLNINTEIKEPGLLEQYLGLDVFFQQNGSAKRVQRTDLESSSYYSLKEMNVFLDRYNALNEKDAIKSPDSDCNLESLWKPWTQYIDDQISILMGDGKKAMSREALDLIGLCTEAEKKVNSYLQFYQMELSAQVRYEKGMEDGELTPETIEYQKKYDEWFKVKEDYSNVIKLLTGQLPEKGSVKGDILKFETNVCSYAFAQMVTDWFLAKANEMLNDYYCEAKLIDLMAGVIEKDMDAILECLKKIKTNKQEWSDAAEALDDGVTKSTFISDYKTTTEAFDEEDIKNLVEEIKNGEQKAKHGKYLAGIVNETKFLNKKVVDAKFFQNAFDLWNKRNKMTVKDFGKLFFQDQKLISADDLKNALRPHINSGNSYYQIAHSVLYDKKKGYSFSKDFLTDTNNDTWKVPPETTFYYLLRDELKEFPELGLIDGFKDNPDEFSTIPSTGDAEIDAFGFLVLVKQVEDEKKPEERFVFTLFDYIDEKQKEDLNEDQQNAEKNLNDKLKENDKEFNKDPEPTPSATPSPSGDGSSIGETIDKIKDYYGVAEENNGDDFKPGDASASKGTQVPKEQSGYTDEGNQASGTMSGGNDFLDALANIGKILVENVYLEEYLTEMFTCDMDKNDEFRNLLGETYGKNGDWYGKEIEYILWGDNNFDKNVDSTYLTIFLIRLAINGVYAFTASDIQAFTRGMAWAIAGAFPCAVPLVQVLLTIALALAESGLDIAQLREGKDVVIFKSANTFICSPTGLSSKVMSEAVEKAVEKAEEFVVENCKEFVGKLDKTIGDHLTELDDYIDTTIKTQTEAMKDQVVSFVVNPINNKLCSLAEQSSFAGPVTGQSISDAIDNALQIISDQIKAQQPSMTRDLEEKALELVKSKGIVDTLKEKLTAKLPDNKFNPIEIGAVLETELRDRLNKIDDFTDTISKYKSDLIKEAKNGLRELENKGVEAFEGYMDDVSNKVTDKINGRISEYAKDWTERTGGISNPTGGTSLTLNYKEYCKIFVLIGVSVDDKPMLQRAAALMQLNVRAGYGEKKKANPQFDATTACTLFRVTTNVKMKTLLPWGVDISEGDSVEKKGWTISLEDIGSYDATVIYTGVAGY